MAVVCDKLRLYQQEVRKEQQQNRDNKEDKEDKEENL